jgi:ubiquinone/menaquinone biosynthesis C-methylase UbiE
MGSYVHGYSEREGRRLAEQAAILAERLHAGTQYPPGSLVLEAGCGVGAQTLELARRSPGAHFTSVDISDTSLARAREAVSAQGITNVTFERRDLAALPDADGSFDHVFVCFVLEHLTDTAGVLEELKRVLRPGGSLTLIEGDHGSCFWYPRGEAAAVVWECLIAEQQALGHNPLIGRQLYPLLKAAGFDVVELEPRWVYADARAAEQLAGGVDQIFVPMVATAHDAALASGRCDEDTWQRGIAELAAVARSPEGSLFYTWFKALAVK